MGGLGGGSDMSPRSDSLLKNFWDHEVADSRSVLMAGQLGCRNEPLSSFLIVFKRVTEAVFFSQVGFT